MQVASPEPQVRSPEMQVVSPEPRERLPESQQIKLPEPQVESSEMELSEPQVESPEHHGSSEVELPEEQSGTSELHITSPKQQVISSEMQVESSEPQVTPSESQHELSEPREDKSPARSPEMQVASPELRERSPEMEVESHEPQVESCESQYQPSEPQQTKSPVPQTRSPEPQIRSPEPQARSPEPQARSPEPQVRSPEPQVRSPEPQVRSPEPQTRSPEPQVELQTRSPEDQAEEMHIDSPEPQVTITEQPEPSSTAEMEPTEIQEAKSPRLQLPLHETPTTLSVTSPRHAASGSMERPHSPSSPGSLVVEIGSPKVLTGVLSESPHMSKIHVDNVEEQTSTMMQTDEHLTEGREPDVVTLHDLSHPVSFDAGIKERHGSTISDTSEQPCHDEGSLHPLTATDDAVVTSELPTEQIHYPDTGLAAVDNTASPVKLSSDPPAVVGQQQKVSLVTESDLVCDEKRTVSEQDDVMAEMLPDQVYEKTPLEPIAEENMDNSSSDHQQDIENNDNQIVTQSQSLEDPSTKEEPKDDLVSVSQDLETCEPTSKELSHSTGQVDSELPSSEIDLQGDEDNSQVCEMDTDQSVETGDANTTQQVAPDSQDEQVTELSNERPEINNYLPEDVTSGVIVTSPVTRVYEMDEEVSPSSKSVSSIDSDFEESLAHTGLLGPLATTTITTTAVSDDPGTGLEERVVEKELAEVEKQVTEVEKEAELEEESHTEVTYHSEMEQVVDKAVTTTDAETTATPLVEDSIVSATTQAAVTELADTVQEETKSPVEEMYKGADKSENETILVTESAETTSDVVTESTETAGDVICETAIDKEPRVSTGDEEPGETTSNKDIHETGSEKEPPEVVSDTVQYEAAGGDTEPCRTVSEKDPPETANDRMSDNELEASMDTTETSGGSCDNTAESHTALVYLQQQQVPVACDESTKSSSDLKEPSVSLELTQSLDDASVTLDQDDQMTERTDDMSVVPESHVPISAPQQSLSRATEHTSSKEVTASAGAMQDVSISSSDNLVTADKVVTTTADNETTSSVTEVDVEAVTDDSMESARVVPEPVAVAGGGDSDDSGDSSDSSSSDSDSDDNQSTSSSSSHEDQMEATIVTGVDIPSEAGQPDTAHDDAVAIVESGTVKIVDPVADAADVEKKQQEDDMEVSETVKPVLEEVTPQETDQQETVADPLPQTTPVPLQEATTQEKEDTAAKPVRKLRPRPIPADAAQTWESLIPQSKQLHTKSRDKHSEQDDTNNAPTTNVQVASGQVMSVGAYMEQYKNQHPQDFSSGLLQRCGVIIPQVAQHESISKEEGLQRASPAYSKSSQVVSTTSMPVTPSVAVTMGNYAIVGGPKRQSASEYSHDSSVAAAGGGGVEQMRVSGQAERSGPKSLQQLLTGDVRTSSPHDVSGGATADSPSYKGPAKDKVHYYIVCMYVYMNVCVCMYVGICMYIYNYLSYYAYAKITF